MLTLLGLSSTMSDFDMGAMTQADPSAHEAVLQTPQKQSRYQRSPGSKSPGITSLSMSESTLRRPMMISPYDKDEIDTDMPEQEAQVKDVVDAVLATRGADDDGGKDEPDKLIVADGNGSPVEQQDSNNKSLVKVTGKPKTGHKSNMRIRKVPEPKQGNRPPVQKQGKGSKGGKRKHMTMSPRQTTLSFSKIAKNASEPKAP